MGILYVYTSMPATVTKTELICLFIAILLLKINPITVSSKIQCQRTVLFM